MDTNKINMSVVYNTVANMLPTEGRDFVINTENDANNNQRLVIKPLTPLGKDWVPHLQAQLMKTGVIEAVAGDAKPANREYETIAQMVKRLTDEVDAKRATRIAALKKDYERKEAEAESIRKSGKPDAAASDALHQAAKAALESRKAWITETKVAEAVPGIRSRVDKAAEAAAKNDATHGISWDVDMNAEVKTPFDVQDITRKITHKALLIEDIAHLEVAVAERTREAVDLAKQYIINKPAEKGAK